jgi:hypothetical protein
MRGNWVATGPKLDVVERRITLSVVNNNHKAGEPAASRYTDCAIAVPNNKEERKNSPLLPLSLSFSLSLIPFSGLITSSTQA